MKKHFYLLSLTFLLATLGHRASAQTFNGDLTLTTQADVDAFIYTEVNGNLTIEGDPNNADITNLDGLLELTTVSGNFSISNTALTSLTGLGALTSVGGLIIGSNNALTSLTGLGAITSVGELNIRFNFYLTSLMGLPPITSVGGELYIEGNFNLLSLTGLEALTSVGGNLFIAYNSSLLSLTGLDVLNTVGGNLWIDNNSHLTSLTGLDVLNTVGGLYIFNNDLLTSLTGLPAITSVGVLYIAGNSSLTSLTGLPAITFTSVVALFIQGTFLTSLTGLEALTSVGVLYIGENSSLTSLTGLNNIASGTITDLYIQNNPILSTCELQSICNYLAVPGNPATISGNAANCADRPAVEAACLLLPVELVSFQTNMQEDKTILLTWRTASEQNNEGFEIERSMDGSSWEMLDFLPGNGTTQAEQSYSFTDERPIPGTNYYRLRQVDFDGKIEYSEVRSVDFRNPGDFGNLAVYPNPVSHGELTLNFSDELDENTTLRIYSAAGQLVLRQPVQSSGSSLDVSGLAPGSYLLEVTNGAALWQERLIIQKP